MTKEEKELLLRDLSARLPYNVKVRVRYYGDYDNEIQEYVFVLNEIDTKYPTCWYWIGGEQVQECGSFNNGTTSFSTDMDDEDQEIKPYLRPMSSMTEEEREEFRKVGGVMSYNPQNNHYAISAFTPEAYDWLNKNGFDYRGLIPMGLALEAPDGMYEKFLKTE